MSATAASDHARNAPAECRQFPLHLTNTHALIMWPAGFVLGALTALVMEVSLGLFLRAPFLVPAALAGGVLGVLAFRYLALQHQGHVEVVIDEQGIRELDDGALRLAIRWEDARVFAESRSYFSRASLQTFPRVELRFLAPNGEVILVTDDDRHRLCRSLVKRPLAFEVGFVERLPRLASRPPDPRERREYGHPVSRFGRALLFLSTCAMLAHYFHYFGMNASGPPAVHFGDRLAFVIIFGLYPLVLVVTQLLRLRAWKPRRVAPIASAPAGAYRAPGRTDDDDGVFVERMRARARTRLVVYVALFAAVCAFPWIGR